MISSASAAAIASQSLSFKQAYRLYQRHQQHKAQTKANDQRLSQLQRLSARQLWQKLGTLGYFQSTWQGSASHWQPSDRQWLWLAWSLHEPKLQLFLGARGIGKTEILVIFRSLWQLIQQPQSSILLISATLSRSKQLVQLIANMLRALGIACHQQAGTVRLANAYANKSPSLYAGSIGSNMRGHHPDLIIIEDPLEERLMHSKGQKERLMRVINEARRMSDDRLLLIGQLIAPDDPFAQLALSDEVSFVSAWASQYPELIQSQAPPLQKDSYDLQSYSWAVNMEGYFPRQAISPFSQIQQSDQLPESPLIAILDPAFGGFDKSALAIGGTYLNDQGKAVVVAWVFSFAGHWHSSLSQMSSVLESLGVDTIYYEGRRYSEIGREFSDLGFSCRSFESHWNKQYKIEYAASFVVMNRLVLHSSLARQYVEEVRSWHARAPHDDAVDALAMLSLRLLSTGHG